MRSLVTQCLLLVSVLCHAHQPDLSSTILAEQSSGHWVLQIRAALTAFEYEVKARNGDSAYTSPEGFQELVIEHVSQNLAIRIDDDIAVEIQDGLVKLGHETSVAFKVFGIPDDFKKIEVSNSSFSDISRNQSALILVREGFAKEQFILNNDNDHTVELKVVGSKFELLRSNEVIQTPLSQKSTSNLYIIVALFSFSVISYLVYKRKAG